MDFHHRKLLILEKINPSKKGEDVDDKKNDSCEFPCPPNCSDDCKDYLDKVLLPPPPPPQPPSHHSSSILILMLCILGVALFLVSFFSIVRYRSRNSRRRISQPVNETREDFIDEDHGPVVDHPIWYIRTVGLQQSVIDSIAVFKYKTDEGLIEGTDCSVCLSEFQEDENLRLLPKCNHAFHIHCIDTWLRSHKNCPLCRAPIVSEANSAQVNAGEPILNGSGSVEENEAESVQNRGEMEIHDDVEENRTSEIRTRRESVDPLPIEEKNSYPQPARTNNARVKSDFLADHSVKLDEAMEPMRRSISMDASSAAMVYLAGANNFPVEGEGSSHIKDEGCSNVHMVHKMKQNSEIIVLKPENRNSSIYTLVKSSSLGRSLQKVPRSMKQSFSSTGKSSLLPTHSRSQDSY